MDKSHIQNIFLTFKTFLLYLLIFQNSSIHSQYVQLHGILTNDLLVFQVSIYTVHEPVHEHLNQLFNITVHSWLHFCTVFV